MATLFFDFDSTLVSIETLDQLLSEQLDPQTAAQVEAITRQGMNGEIPFVESLEKRLAIAKPTLQQLRAFGEKAIAYIAPGMPELIQRLQKNHRCLIASGGFTDIILPVAQALGIETSDVHAVTARWSKTGEFEGLQPNNPFCESKLAGLRRLEKQWELPTICVGDGMTDYALYQAKLVDYFIAYTEFQKRDFVNKYQPPCAAHVGELSQHIDEILGQNSL